MLWFYLMLIAAMGALLGARRTLILGQWVLQIVMLLLLFVAWRDKEQPGQQYSGVIGALSLMALLFLAPFIVALRGKLSLLKAVVWSALWGVAATCVGRADPQAVQAANSAGTLGFMLIIGAVGAACAALLSYLGCVLSRQSKRF